MNTGFQKIGPKNDRPVRLLWTFYFRLVPSTLSGIHGPGPKKRENQDPTGPGPNKLRDPGPTLTRTKYILVNPDRLGPGLNMRFINVLKMVLSPRRKVAGVSISDQSGPGLTTVRISGTLLDQDQEKLKISDRTMTSKILKISERIGQTQFCIAEINFVQKNFQFIQTQIDTDHFESENRAHS